MTKVILKREYTTREAFEEVNSLNVDSGFLAGGIKKTTELAARPAPSYMRAENLFVKEDNILIYFDECKNGSTNACWQIRSHQ